MRESWKLKPCYLLQTQQLSRHQRERSEGAKGICCNFWCWNSPFLWCAWRFCQVWVSRRKNTKPLEDLHTMPADHKDQSDSSSHHALTGIYCKSHTCPACSGILENAFFQSLGFNNLLMFPEWLLLPLLHKLQLCVCVSGRVTVNWSPIQAAVTTATAFSCAARTREKLYSYFDFSPPSPSPPTHPLPVGLQGSTGGGRGGRFVALWNYAAGSRKNDSSSFIFITNYQQPDNFFSSIENLAVQQLVCLNTLSYSKHHLSLSCALAE